VAIFLWKTTYYFILEENNEEEEGYWVCERCKLFSTDFLTARVMASL
jgi:hypothetical protein